MTHLALHDPAPDFTLPDHQGRLVTLSDLYASQYVLLVFNLGFV